METNNDSENLNKNLNKVEQVRHSIFGVPWKTATIVMDGGIRYEIPSKDHVFMAPGEPVFLVVCPVKDAFEVVFIDQIKSVEVQAGKAIKP